MYTAVQRVVYSKHINPESRASTRYQVQYPLEGTRYGTW